MSNITDTEVRYRIEQAFEIAPSMTVGMLKAYLNARIPLSIRTSVLEQLKQEGKIVAENRTLYSYKGMTTQVTILRWVGVRMIEEGRKRAS
jgi:hypothetical protein